MVGNSDHKISAMNKNLKSLKNHRMNSFDHNSKSKLVWGYPICLYVLLNQTSLKVLRVTILLHGRKPIFSLYVNNIREAIRKIKCTNKDIALSLFTLIPSLIPLIRTYEQFILAFNNQIFHF